MIARDKQLHLGAGLCAGLASLVVYIIVGLALMPLGVEVSPAAAVPVPFIAALVAGATKEASDWLDNRGTPGMHEVSYLDVAATAAPGLAMTAALTAWCIFFPPAL